MQFPVNFPFYYDVYVLDEIYDILPIEFIVDRPVNEEQLNTVQKYFLYTFPAEYSFEAITKVADTLDLMNRNFAQYDYIIAPGDSPSVYIQTMKYLGFDMSRVITFPLSGLGEPDVDINQLKVLLRKYLEEILPPLQGLLVGIFDYGESRQYG